MKKHGTPSDEITNLKLQDLEYNKSDAANQFLTTNQGLKINDDNNTLKAGSRGPSLLEDFLLREKMTHFDHERIPERIVHARGSAAHGFFQVYESMEKYTKAGFLQDPSVQTPVFTRFSTVGGSRGSTDLARDVRGFAVKFYTQDGVYDLVGNNMPVFFIQDAIKFPDLVHAVKPEPHNEIPQASSAHDTFWDFISLMPESMHHIMWLMSDRAIPRSFRMMEGFGVHTFRFINKNNESHFVKFHWKPKLGTHAVVWDEAQKISGKNPDFHRQDLWEAIETGNFPEWELGVQIVPEADEFKFDFDLLDSSKLIPEELVPVVKIGKMVLNRNPDSFFAETEQVAFHPGHIVPGIDFTNDPLLQGRLFSYSDTQLSRLGSVNFHEIPINKSISPTFNNQREGHMRQEVNVGRASYHPNTLGGGCPFQASVKDGGFTSFNERIDAHKIRERSESFSDHFSQATMFYNSMTKVEKNHIIKAFRFELGKVEVVYIQNRMLGLLSIVDKTLAAKVAKGLGLDVPNDIEKPLNHGVGANPDPNQESKIIKSATEKSDALSMLRNPIGIKSIATRQIAFLCADGVDDLSVKKLKNALMNEGAEVHIIAPHLGNINTADGNAMSVDKSFLITSSVLYDAVFVPSGNSVAVLKADSDVIDFINEAYKHCKVIGADQEGIELLTATNFSSKFSHNSEEMGVIVSTKDGSINFADSFISAMKEHRFWNREPEL